MSRLYDIYLESTRPSKLITILLMLLCAAGLMVASPNYRTNPLFPLSGIGPAWGWSLLFVLLAFLRGIELFSYTCGILAEFLVPVTCTWVWTILLTMCLSATPILGMGLMYLVPLGVELWFISRAVENRVDSSSSSHPTPV